MYHPLLIALPILGALTGCRGSSSPDSYPNRPIKLIVPFAAGGGTDTFARIIKKSIDDEALLPQPLVIVNIGGAGGTIGSRRVKHAKPDGYTIMLLHEAILTAQAAGTVSYGPEAFDPVAGTGAVQMVVAVPAASPYRDLGDLMKSAADRPDSITFGANLGALSHYAGLLLERQQPGAHFRFVQCGGGAKRFSDLKGGHIQVTSFSLEEFARFRADGLRGVAVLADTRHAATPEVPSAQEQGFDVVISNTFYWWVPKGTPRRALDTLSSALRHAMQTRFVQQKLAEMHCEPLFVRGEPLHARIARSSQSLSSVSRRQTVKLPNVAGIVLAATAVLLAIVLVEQVVVRRGEDTN